MESIEKKNVFHDLLVNEDEYALQLVAKSRKLIGVDSKTGKTVLKIPKSSISDREVISLLLLGRFASNKLGLAQTDSMTVDELINEINKPSKTVYARLIELQRERIVAKVSPTTYKISYTDADRLLNLLSKKLGLE